MLVDALTPACAQTQTDMQVKLIRNKHLTKPHQWWSEISLSDLFLHATVQIYSNALLENMSVKIKKGWPDLVTLTWQIWFLIGFSNKVAKIFLPLKNTAHLQHEKSSCLATEL